MDGLRIQSGDTDQVRSFFGDGGPAPTGIGGLSPTVRIWRVSDGQWWNGTGYQAGVPSAFAMTELDVTARPGFYVFAFDTSAGGGATPGEHVAFANANSSLPSEPEQIGNVYVGEWVDLVVTMRGTDGVDTAAMRGTDGVDTAAMRGTDGVDTAAMRGTDGANTTVPLVAAVDAAAHVATQALVSAIPTPPTAGAIADAVLLEPVDDHAGTAGSLAELVRIIKRVSANKVTVAPDDLTVTVFEDNGTTPAIVFTISADRRDRTP